MLKAQTGFPRFFQLWFLMSWDPEALLPLTLTSSGFQRASPLPDYGGDPKVLPASDVELARFYEISVALRRRLLDDDIFLDHRRGIPEKNV